MLFPRIENGEIKDGLLAFAPKGCNLKKCESKNGGSPTRSGYITQQACGFSRYIDENGTVYCGLLISGYFDKEKIKGKLVTKAVFTENQVKEAIAYQNTINTSKERVKKEEEFTKDLLHEIRQLNTMIKAQTEELLTSEGPIVLNPQWQNVDKLGQNIFATSSLITSRILSYDLIKNPDLMALSDKIKIGPYKKFDKIKKISTPSINKQGKTIEIVGVSHRTIYANGAFDLLPFLLIDNAIKYSTKSGNIRIQFNETPENINITVENDTTYIDKTKLSQLFEKGNRGPNSEHTAGSGIGLWLARTICKANNIDISLDVERKNDWSVNGLDHKFIVKLRMA